MRGRCGGRGAWCTVAGLWMTESPLPVWLKLRFSFLDADAKVEGGMEGEVLGKRWQAYGFRKARK